MSPRHALPEGLLLSFYGDDLTGSCAVMEVLSFAGLPTILFLEPPTAAELANLGRYRAIGVAGVSRSRSTDWMNGELPAIFKSLMALRSPVTQYKICSTLDSSPRIGSIGRAIEIAQSVFQTRTDAANWVPLLVAAPPIGRYQAFGHLFASHDGQNYRLDRHPVMRRHPATPMGESDVAVHVSRQTAQPIGLVDVIAIKGGRGHLALEDEIVEGRSIISLDVLDDETLTWAGCQIWERRGRGIFAVGSQGIEYALLAYWRSVMLLPRGSETPEADAVEQVAIASGSVSVVTAGQIEWAVNHGFDLINLDASKAVSEVQWAKEIDLAVERAKAVLSRGRSVIVATAQGPDDPAVAALNTAIEMSSASAEDINTTIGTGLGLIIRQIIESTGLRRVGLAGGDSSGFGARKLGVRALTGLAPLANGAPLCRVISDRSAIHGTEIVLKGGQMGAQDFFGTVRAGREAR